MAAITSTNVANAIVKLVAADALPVLVGNLVMGNLVNRDYEPVLAHAGDTVNVPIPPTMVAHNLLEGETVQTQNPSLGNAQIVLNTHAEATFQIPDVTKVLAVPDLLRIYMQPSVAAASVGACASGAARAGIPSKATSVPTTGTPRATASRIFCLIPLPKRSGATTAAAPDSNLSRSSTNPSSRRDDLWAWARRRRVGLAPLPTTRS